jgi:hypothetical protein
VFYALLFLLLLLVGQQIFCQGCIICPLRRKEIKEARVQYGNHNGHDYKQYQSLPTGLARNLIASLLLIPLNACHGGLVSWKIEMFKM